MVVELTQEQIVGEILKCRQNPIYYLESYGKVRHPIKGLLPFKLFDFQKDVVLKVVKNRFVIIVKSRQLGLSTLMAGYVAWFASFYNNKEILILANKGEVATKFVAKVAIFLHNVPDFLKPEIKVENRQSLELGNGSIIRATTTTEDSGRSDALSLLVIDEAAMIKKVEEVYTAARPTLSTGGACVIISTPKGIGNWFHKKYVEAETGNKEDSNDVNFVPMKLPWYLHPERDQAWADHELKDMGPTKFAQEHDCVTYETKITVLDTITNEIKEIKIGELFNEL